MPVTYKLTGVEGTVWEFGDSSCPLRLVTDPEGIAGAPFKNLRAQNLQEDGARWIDRNDEPLKITLDVHLKGQRLSAEEALAAWSLWRKSLGRGDLEMELEITSPGGGVRTCKPRLEEQLGKANLDYITHGRYFRETVILMPDESWFRKEEVHNTYFAADFATASVNNAGDIESPLRYKLTGPLTAPTLGILGENVTLTGTTIPTGEVWTIETDPGGRYVKDAAGVNKMPVIYENADGPVGWHKLAPRHAVTPVTLSASGTTGASKIEVFLPQLFVEGAA